MRCLEALLMPSRKKLADGALKRLLEEQEHTCWECQEKVTEQSYDVHRIQRLSLSAGEDANNPSNLAILCRCCRARHTEEEQLALGDTRPLTIESQVSNRVKHLLDSTNPPPQIVWGQRQKAKHKTQHSVQIDCNNQRTHGNGACRASFLKSTYGASTQLPADCRPSPTGKTAEASPFSRHCATWSTSTIHARMSLLPRWKLTDSLKEWPVFQNETLGGATGSTP